MNKATYDNLLAILKGELIPSMGCTEPIAVAFCSAKAREVLGKMPEKMVMYCSGNIVKNVKGVVVPNSGGQRGIDVAAVLGVVANRADLELEVVSKVTEEQIAETRALVESGMCKCELAVGEENLYIRAELFAGDESAVVVVSEKHNHIAKIVKNGEVVFEATAGDAATGGADKSKLNLEDSYEFAKTCDLADIEPIIARQIEMNCKISEEGLTNKWGANVGKTLMERYENPDVMVRARAAAAAGADARMAGCALPVVINSGSGNQGITVSMPIITYAKEVGCDQETLYRALVLANLVSLQQKYYIGNLSAYCGATSAGASAVCGVAFIDGADVDMIGHIVVNSINTVGGMVCDGAKSSCASKIAVSLESAFLAYEMAKKDRNLQPGEGMIVEDMGQTIKNVGRMGRVGMASTDIEVLNIMLGN